MSEAGKTVRSTCPYCGVGCQVDLQIQENHITGWMHLLMSRLTTDGFVQKAAMEWTMFHILLV